MQDDASSSFARATSPVPGSWERPQWAQEQLAVESRRTPLDMATDDATDSAQPKRRLTPGFWSKALGATGLVLGTVGAGVLAHQMGYDWRFTALIAALVGIAGGALGAMLPLLLRALVWAILAALIGSVGVGALYLLLRLAPAFVERFVR
jgi:hypothetical protein